MHYDQDNNCSYVQTITQSCPYDTIEFAINISSLRGLVDVSTIQWNEPEILPTPEKNTLTYNKDMLQISKIDRAVKIYADINRICELEDTVVEWYDEKYYDNKHEIIDLSFLNDMFQIKCVDYSGVDNPVVRIQLKAKAEGKLLKSHYIGYLPNYYFGLGILVKSEGETTTNETKRKGFMCERNLDVQL